MSPREKFFRIANYGVTGFAVAVYVASLVRLLIEGKLLNFVLTICVSAVGVAICSVVRNLINAKRPYELMDFENYLGKKTAGKSFPSRHVFSVFIIATCVFHFYRIPGIALFIVGFFLCYLRVAARVHFVRDVLAGAVFGILLGLPIYLF